MKGRRITRAEARRAAEARVGAALCLGVVLAFVALVWAAYQADAARGMTVTESLATAGL